MNARLIETVRGEVVEVPRDSQAWREHARKERARAVALTRRKAQQFRKAAKLAAWG